MKEYFPFGYIINAGSVNSESIIRHDYVGDWYVASNSKTKATVTERSEISTELYY